MAEMVRLESVEKNTVAEMNALLKQLNPEYEPVNATLLKEMIAHPDAELWSVCDGSKIVGIAILFIVHKLSGKTAYVDHVVVDDSYRGQGLGKKLMEKMIERAKARGARKVDLTSRPDRTAANKLYQKLGFELRKTNPYSLKLK